LGRGEVELIVIGKSGIGKFWNWLKLSQLKKLQNTYDNLHLKLKIHYNFPISQFQNFKISETIFPNSKISKSQ